MTKALIGLIFSVLGAIIREVRLAKVVYTFNPSPQEAGGLIRGQGWLGLLQSYRSAKTELCDPGWGGRGRERGVWRGSLDIHKQAVVQVW